MLILVCAAASLIGCSARLDHEAIPDDRIGLSKVDVRDIPDPGAVVDNTTEPGEGRPLPRAYEGAPPLVSHTAEGYLPITREENLCLECHMIEGEAEEGLPTPIPASHYTDLRNAPSVVGDEVAGARYNCSACHVAQTGTVPLVTSRF